MAIGLMLGLMGFGQCAQGRPVKCGTRDYLGPAARIAAVPVLPESQVTPSGHGVIHFALSGEDAVTSTFADSAAAIFDHVWAVEVDSLGYPAPVTDVDGCLHLYLVDLATMYGYTVPDRSTGTGIGSYMVCDNDFLDPAFGTRGINGLRVTLAHEFFHTIQFKLRLDSFHSYFYEWSSTWMEEVVYPQINDYFWYLPGFFDQPEASIRTMDGVREYATGILLMMIDREWGRSVIQRCWQDFSAVDQDPFVLLQTELAGQGVPVDSLAGTFLCWNLLTGDRAVHGFGYPDAPYFPAWRLTSGNDGNFAWHGEPGEWGMVGGVLPGGVQGRANVTLQSTAQTVAIAAAVQGSRVEWTSAARNDSLLGSRSVVGALSLDPDRQRVHLQANPERSGLPVRLTLSPAVPNPSNGFVHWVVSLDRPGPVEAMVYNVLGQRVAILHVSSNGGREVRLSWDGKGEDGTSVASGMYILRAVSGTASDVGKVVLVH